MRTLFILILICLLSATAHAQFSKDMWTKGYYYDLGNTKHAGLLAWKAPYRDSTGVETLLRFKTDAKAEPQNIPVNGITSLVIDRYNSGRLDSFKVSHNPILISRPLIEVLVVRNQLKLYRSVSYVMGKAVRFPNGRTSAAYPVIQYDYYFGPDDEHITLLDQQNFREAMVLVMADNAEAVRQIQNKDLQLQDIPTLLYVYDHGELPPAAGGE